jgi:hypothetical protein
MNERGSHGPVILGVAHIALGGLSAILVAAIALREPLSAEHHTLLAIAASLCVLLVVAGVGLVAHARWGRVVSHVWAAGVLVAMASAWAIVLVSARHALTVVADDPGYAAHLWDHHLRALVWSGAFWSTLLAAYPIVSIIVVARAKRR